MTDGPIFYLVKLLNPDLHFQFITINKFTKADECEHHFDTGNKGPSRLIMFGNFSGGALVLDDGRVFSEKRVWHEYDGSKIGHRVAPFEGERISLVAYTPKVIRNTAAIFCPAVPFPTGGAGGNAAPTFQGGTIVSNMSRSSRGSACNRGRSWHPD